MLGADEVAEGDSRYLARELLNGDTSNLPAADIFSLALSAVELAGGFHLPSGDEDYHALRNGVLPWDLLAHLSEPLRGLLAAMAAPEAAHRPSAQTILEHPALVAYRLRQGGAASRAGVLEALVGSSSADRAAAAPANAAEPVSGALAGSEGGAIAMHNSRSADSGPSALGRFQQPVEAAAASAQSASSLPAVCALLASIDELLAGSPGSGLAETRVLGVVAALTPFSAGPTPLHGRAASGDGSGSGGDRSVCDGLSDCAMGVAAAEGVGAGGGRGIGLAWSPPGQLQFGGAVTTPFSPGLRVRELGAGRSEESTISVQPAAASVGGGPPGLVLSAAAAAALRQDLHALLAVAGLLPVPSLAAPAKTPSGGGFKAGGGGPGPVTAARAALAPAAAGAEYSPEI